jgi:hypothetical protein
MDKYQVTLIFIDDPNNHQKALSQIGERLYNKVVNFDFTQFDALKNFIEADDNKNDEFLLFIHVFRENKRGYNNAIKNQLIREYPLLTIHWVTSDRPGIVSDEIKEHNNVYKYDEIPDKIDKGILKPVQLSNEKTTKEQSNKQYIFISHSTEDKDIVNSFRENILQLGLDVPKDNIFCSSNPSTGIKTGEDIPDELKNALKKMTLFIQYVSDNYKRSEVCLNEMGAAWLNLPKSKNIILKAPNIKFTEVGFLNVQRIGLNINDKNDLLKFYDDNKDLFPNAKQADYNKKIDEFIGNITI